VSIDPSRAGAPDEAERADAALGAVPWGELPAGARRFRFDAPSGALAAFALGRPDAPRVVLVAGATGSKEDFLLLAPPLAEAGYLVEAFDLAGNHESAGAGPAATGRSGVARDDAVEGRARHRGRGPRHGYTERLFVDDLVAFLAAGSPAHLLGYSFAGLIAERVAVEHPELVRSLTLLTAPPMAGQAFRGMRWIGALAPFVTPHVGAGLMIWGIMTNKNRVDAGRLAFVRARMAGTSRAAVDDMVAIMMDAPDHRGRLRASGLPLLVAVGERDLWSTGRHARFAREIGAELAVYRTGHSLCETAPHQLARDMLALFSRSGPTSGSVQLRDPVSDPAPGEETRPDDAPS